MQYIHFDVIHEGFELFTLIKIGRQPVPQLLGLHSKSNVQKADRSQMRAILVITHSNGCQTYLHPQELEEFVKGQSIHKELQQNTKCSGGSTRCIRYPWL